MELPKVLGFWDGIAVSVGLIIGAGIFMTAPGVCAMFTTPGPALFLWLLGAVLSTLGALTFAELAATHPKTGGIYVFLLEGFGRPFAFVFGWKQLVMAPAGLGALGVAFASFFTQFFGVEWDPAAVATVTIAVLTAVSVFSTRHAALVMKVFTSIKVLALAALIVLGAALISPNPGHFTGLATFEAVQPDMTFLGAMGLGLFAVVWTYGGWETVTMMSGETRDPQKTMPRIILGSILVVTVIYLAVNLVYVNALGVAGIGASTNVAGDTGTRMLGNAFGSAITFMILCSIFGAINGTVLTNARVTYALARSGLAFRFFGYQHPKLETPIAALVWQGVASIAFIFIAPHFFELLGYQVLADTGFFVLAAASLFMFRHRGDPSPFRVPLYPWTPLLFILLNVAMMVNEFFARPGASGIILGILAAGFPVYLLWRVCVPSRQAEPATPERSPL